MDETQTYRPAGSARPGPAARDRRLGVVAALAVVIALSGLGVWHADRNGAAGGEAPAAIEPAPPPAAETVTVAMLDNRFEPDLLAVAPGSTVRFVNEGAAQHNVVAMDGAFASEMVAPGAAYEARFDAAGTHEVVCAPHAWRGMRLEVTVR